MVAYRERFDVVAVGYDDPKAIPRLASELAQMTGIATAQVASALRHGEFVVHHAFDPDDAERAADVLRGLGMVVALRPSASAVEDLELDLGEDGGEASERRHPISRRFSSLGGAGVGPLPDEWRVEGRRMDIGTLAEPEDPLLDPTRPQGRPQATADRPFASSHARRRKSEAVRAPSGAERRRSRPPSVTPPVSTAGSIELLTRLEAAADRDTVPEVITLDGQQSESVEIRLAEPLLLVDGDAPLPDDEASAHSAAGARAWDEVPAANVITPLAIERRGAVRDTTYGITPRPLRRTATSAPEVPVVQPPVPVLPPQLQLDTTPVPERVRPVAYAPSTTRSGVHRRSQRRPLLGSDPVAATLFGLAIGCAVGFVVVQAAGVGQVGAEAHALEAELARARVHGPSASLRDADAIEGELARLHRGARLRFLAVLFGTAVPLGLVLARLRI